MPVAPFRVHRSDVKWHLGKYEYEGLTALGGTTYLPNGKVLRQATAWYHTDHISPQMMAEAETLILRGMNRATRA